MCIHIYSTHNILLIDKYETYFSLLYSAMTDGNFEEAYRIHQSLMVDYSSEVKNYTISRSSSHIFQGLGFSSQYLNKTNMFRA